MLRRVLGFMGRGALILERNHGLQTVCFMRAGSMPVGFMQAGHETDLCRLL